jgi:positive regulator of sigma E activity
LIKKTTYKTNRETMKNYLIPAIGIIIITIILVVINEFTEINFVKDYAYVFIIAAMLLGVWLAKLSGRPSDKKNINL